MRLLLAGVALTLSALVAAASLRADGSTVRIDAIVTDARGRTVENLKIDDVQVFEDGTARPVSSIRLIKTGTQASPDGVSIPIASGTAEREEAGREGTRLFAFFLDEYHVSASDAAAAKQTLTRLVAALDPRDLLVVIKP